MEMTFSDRIRVLALTIDPDAVAVDAPNWMQARRGKAMKAAYHKLVPPVFLDLPPRRVLRRKKR